jgi:LCP family protein required for cell wall assembly
LEENNIQSADDSSEKTKELEQSGNNLNNADFYSSRGLKIEEKDTNQNNNLPNNIAEQFNLGEEKHSRMDKHKNGRTKKVLCIIACLILLFGSMAFGYYRIRYGNGGKENLVKTEWGDIMLDVPQSDQMVNVLAIGFDKGGYRTDTMIIISFDPKTSKVNLISIPRDTLIGIKGKRMKLNAAFGVGKFDMTINAIKKLTGLPIHYYVAVDTAGFKNIIDVLGGVQFDVPKDMKYYDPYQNLNINLKKGPQLLNGDKAEQLVRYRKYASADLEREEVQKKFIKALIEQKLTLANASDVTKMKGLYDNITKYIKTNATFNDGVKYFVSAMKIKSDSFQTFTLPGQPKMINGVSYYIYDKAKTDQLISQLGLGKEQKTYASNNSDIQLYDMSTLGGQTKQGTSENKTGSTTKEEVTPNESDLTKKSTDKTGAQENKTEDKNSTDLNSSKTGTTTKEVPQDNEIENNKDTAPQDTEEMEIDGITYPESEIQ